MGNGSRLGISCTNPCFAICVVCFGHRTETAVKPNYCSRHSLLDYSSRAFEHMRNTTRILYAVTIIAIGFALPDKLDAILFRVVVIIAANVILWNKKL